MRWQGVLGSLLTLGCLSACSTSSEYTVLRVEVGPPTPAFQCDDAPCSGPNVQFSVRSGRGMARPACTVSGSYKGRPFEAQTVAPPSGPIPHNQQSVDWVGVAILSRSLAGIRVNDITVRCRAG